MQEMRNNKRQMTAAQATVLLETGEYGILSVCAEEGQPYGVPLSYVAFDRVIYFHCALEGHKLRLMGANPKVCFTVVGKTQVLPSQFSTKYESIIVFGEGALVEQEKEKRMALELLLKKYSPDFLREGMDYIDKAITKTHVYKIIIRHMTGKHRV